MDLDPTTWCRDAGGFVTMALAIWALIVCGILAVPAEGSERDPPMRPSLPPRERRSRASLRRRRVRRTPPLATRVVVEPGHSEVA